MNERERLIELLSNAKKYATNTMLYLNMDEAIDISYDDLQADYLLKNGVIVPPVKVGDTVYGISRGAIIPIGVDRIQYSKRGIDILGRNEQHYGNGTITLHPENDVGIEWYTTKEEAEKTLKGGNEE